MILNAVLLNAEDPPFYVAHSITGEIGMERTKVETIAELIKDIRVAHEKIKGLSATHALPVSSWSQESERMYKKVVEENLRPFVREKITPLEIELIVYDCSTS